MDITSHCKICNHQKIDFKVGTLCSITDKKPDFHNRCIKADFSEKLETKIEQINVEYEKVRKTRLLVYANFIIFLSVAFAVILAGFYLAKYLLKFNAISSVPFIISLVGVLFVLPIAIGPLNSYLNDLKLAKQRKNELDQVLEIYNINYDINIEFGKAYHGTQDVYVDLKVN
ncbi:hypothetical protein [uncultured Winogradskyella sp.]|uniref:hypothetical protein n=1 Tax=uncultured Winogradskyella sp. TaxID=395353 RepID=UPI00262ADAB7|nr:hypothetical protein [uncultured Winogradskyella sp.]